MDAKRYREATRRTWNGHSLTPEGELSNIGLGIAGEAGEIVDLIKKTAYHGHEMDVPDLIKELGDLFYYAERLMDAFGISHEEVRIKNIMKLQERYPKGFREEDSINREL
jgi:NTP pyrophosphatase (non-canonical NTP hydrolase)